MVHIFYLTDEEARIVREKNKRIRLYNPHFDVSITVEAGNVHGIKDDERTCSFSISSLVPECDIGGVPYAN